MFNQKANRYISTEKSTKTVYKYRNGIQVQKRVQKQYISTETVCKYRKGIKALYRSYTVFIRSYRPYTAFI